MSEGWKLVIVIVSSALAAPIFAIALGIIVSSIEQAKLARKEVQNTQTDATLETPHMAEDYLARALARRAQEYTDHQVRNRMAMRAPRVITEDWLWHWMIGRRPNAWILHVCSDLGEDLVTLSDRAPAMDACSAYMRRGYRIVELEQRLVDAMGDSIRNWERPRAFIPADHDIHIYLHHPSIERAHWVNDNTRHETMTRTEFLGGIEFGQESEIQERARQELIASMGLPSEAIRNYPTSGSTYACAYEGGRRGGNVNPTRWHIFQDEDRRKEERMKNALEGRLKALALFKSCLTEKELNEFTNFSTITVWNQLGVFRIDASTNDRYTFQAPPTFNVYSGSQVYCVNIASSGPRVNEEDTEQDDSYYPFYDHILAQILILKTDPERFLNTANRRGVSENV